MYPLASLVSHPAKKGYLYDMGDIVTIGLADQPRRFSKIQRAPYQYDPPSNKSA